MDIRSGARKLTLLTLEACKELYIHKSCCQRMKSRLKFTLTCGMTDTGECFVLSRANGHECVRCIIYCSNI